MKRSIRTTFAIVGSALLGFGFIQHAQAATPWAGSWNYSNCSGSLSWGNSYNCTDSIAPNNATMNMSGWSSDLSPSSNFAAAAVYPWGSNSGFGIVSKEECANSSTVCDPSAGPHAADGSGNLDAFLLKFSNNPGEIVKVALDNISIGWNGTDNPTTRNNIAYNDSDISVYYYTGSTAPDMTSISAIGDGSGSGSVAGLQGATGSTAVGGWKLLNHYANVGASNGTTPGGSVSLGNTGTGAISSSWWLVTASNNKNGDKVADAFKLLSVAGSGTTTTNKTPEPGSLALAALALFGVAAVRRRAKKLGT